MRENRTREELLKDATKDRPYRVLLAWEFGAGLTHVRNILGVAERLRAEGVECLAALYRPLLADTFEELGIPVVQTYVWPGRRRTPLTWKERETRSLGDVLANLGIAHPDFLAEAIAHYDGLFALFEPDAVVCENAFGALLAARGHLPAFAFGNGAGLPPEYGDGFALWHGFEGAPSWPEAEVLAGINAGLARSGRTALMRLNDLLRIEGVYPYGPVPFDIYTGKRAHRILPPSLPDLPRPTPIANGSEVFVYLHGFLARNAAFMQTLLEIGRPMRVYIPDMPQSEAEALVAHGHHVESGPVPVEEIIARSRCVLHHGGQQLTTVCLAAGLPQVIMAKELENVLAGRFVEARGTGLSLPMKRVDTTSLVAAVRTACDDPDMKARAAALAPDIADWLEPDPSAIVVRTLLTHLG